MGSHNVLGTGNQHISIVVFAGHDSSLLTSEHGQHFENSHMGMMYATIGGDAVYEIGHRYNKDLTKLTGLPTAGLRLEGGINRPKDVNFDIKVYWHDFEFYCASTISSLFAKVGCFNINYSDNVAYGAIPRANSRYYNSSSFSHGLLLAAGISVPNLSNTGLVVMKDNISYPGWDKPLPLHAFR